MTSPPPSQSPPRSNTSSPIWSSRTPSPISSPQTSAPSTSHSTSSANSVPTHSEGATADPSTTTHFTIPQSIEGSEQPLIARTHYTNGYRAGISAGKDDPEIAQGGFDEGFPLGAALAMRVGYLLEVVRRLLREGTELESKVGSIGTADGRVKVVEEQAQAGTREAQLADAERELSLESLVREMETLGVLRDGASADSGQPTALQDTISLLPSMTKWSHLVEARGKAATPG